ncbi:MAG: hypothetical protein WCG25_00585 [bacterium]
MLFISNNGLIAFTKLILSSAVFNFSYLSNNNFTFSGSFIRLVIQFFILLSVSVHINSFNFSFSNAFHAFAHFVVSVTIASICLLSITGLLVDVVLQDHLSLLQSSSSLFLNHNHGKASHNLFSFSLLILVVILLFILSSIESFLHVHAI